jgi:SAM-dependent methyltransferase
VIAAALALLSATLVAQSRPSLDIHYVPTPNEAVEVMLRLAGIGATDVVYDLGSGDGRIVIAAARQFGARGVGIELDPDLVKRARTNAARAGVEGLVEFREADLFKTDLSPATVVTLFLSPSMNLRLESKLKRELRPGARIVAYRFPVGTWRADQDVPVGRERVFLWTLPAAP